MGSTDPSRSAGLGEAGKNQNASAFVNGPRNDAENLLLRGGRGKKNLKKWRRSRGQGDTAKRSRPSGSVRTDVRRRSPGARRNRNPRMRSNPTSLAEDACSTAASLGHAARSARGSCAG